MPREHQQWRERDRRPQDREDADPPARTEGEKKALTLKPSAGMISDEEVRRKPEPLTGELLSTWNVNPEPVSFLK